MGQDDATRFSFLIWTRGFEMMLQQIKAYFHNFAAVVASQCLSFKHLCLRKQYQKLMSMERPDITLQMCRSATGYFSPFCQRTKCSWTQRHLISQTKSLGKVKAACVSKVKNLWLSGSSACRAGGMVITELSLCPVSLLIKGWADNTPLLALSILRKDDNQW